MSTPSAAAGVPSTGEVVGYTSGPSVNKGESPAFHISVTPAQSYTIEIYRIGWHASGAWVFASGTTSWGWAPGRQGYESPGIQQMTRSLLNLYRSGP